MREMDIVQEGTKITVLILTKEEEHTNMETPQLERYISNLEKYCPNNLQGFGPIWWSYQLAIKTLKERSGAV